MVCVTKATVCAGVLGTAVLRIWIVLERIKGYYKYAKRKHIFGILLTRMNATWLEHPNHTQAA